MARTLNDSLFHLISLSAFRTMPSAIMEHTIMNPNQLSIALWDHRKMSIEPTSTSKANDMTAGPIDDQDKYHYSLPAYVPMIEPSAFALIVNDDVFDHPHSLHHGTRTQTVPESRQTNVSERRNILSRVRSSRGPLSVSTTQAAAVVVKTQLRSQVQTKILAIIYNPDSTKFKTITHTKYFSTRITVRRTTAGALETPFTRIPGPG